MKAAPWSMVAVGASLLVGVAVWILAGDNHGSGAQHRKVIARGDTPVPATVPLEFRDGGLYGEQPAQPLDVTADSEAAFAAPVSPSVVLTGRVTRAGSGRPIAAVEVSARLTTVDGRASSTSVAVTDAEGVYRIVPDHGGTLVRLEVSSGPDTTRTTQRSVHAVPEGEQTIVDVEVPEGIALSGSVIDEEGRPVAFAEVFAWTGSRRTIESERLDEPDRIVRADAAGAFEVSAVGPRFLIEARSEGFVAADRLYGEIQGITRVSDLVLRLSPARSLHVQVRGYEDRAQSSATVRVQQALRDASERVTEIAGVFRSGPRKLTETTDVDGRVELRDLASLVYEVEVEHGRHAPWTGSHAPGDPDLLVRLDPGASLFGIVTDVTGAPIPHAQVQVSSTDPSLMDHNRRGGHTDSDGRFELVGLLPDDEGLLSVVAPGHAVNVIEGLSFQQGMPREVSVMLGPEFLLSGIVTDATGEPIARALVEIEGDRVVDFGRATMSPTPTWERMFDSLDDALSDAGGRFRLGSLYDGVFRIRVTDPDDAANVALLDARSGDDELLVVLDSDLIAGVELAGRVRNALTGRPITEFEVTPLIPSGMGGLAGTARQVSDDQGSFRVVGLEPGPIRVDVQAKGYAPWTQALREHGPGQHWLDVDLTASRTVRLRFVDAQGGPVVGADVRFSAPDGKLLMVAHGPGSRTMRLRTDARGEVIASELPADRIAVGLACGWMEKERVYTVDLRAPPSGPIELVVDLPLRSELTFLVVADASGTRLAHFDLVESSDGILAMQSRLQEGTWSSLDVPAHVEVRDGTGHLVAEGSTTRGASVSIGAIPELVAVARLTVPREALAIRVEAPGYTSVELSWSPHSDIVGCEAIAISLAPR